MLDVPEAFTATDQRLIPAVQCCGVCLSECTIVYEHDRVDKIRVDSTWQHVHIQTFCIWYQGSEVDLLVHTKSRQSYTCYIAAMFNDRTYKESKESKGTS